jgi:ketosteroid isomerase-like protein
VTSANVQLVRRIFDRWERGDFSASDWAAPGIEFVLADGPNPGRWSGVAAMGRAWFEAISAFADLTVTAEEIRELDDGRVLVLTKNGGRGKTSGLELDEMRTRGANVFRIEDGRVTKLVLYFERDEALAELRGQTPDS